MQSPSSISIGLENVMSAIAGALKAAFRQGQKSCPQTPEMLSLDTLQDIAKEHEIGVQPLSRRLLKPSKTGLKQSNLVSFTQRQKTTNKDKISPPWEPGTRSPSSYQHVS